MRYVLYHGNCYDGFGAAFAAWKKFGSTDTKYLPVSYGMAPPEMPDAKEIFILDFSYSEATILELSKRAQVTVLDHHKTAKEMLGGLAQDTQLDGAGNPHVEFDMNRSGALISWHHFHPNTPAPILILHISDRDLWTFAIPGSHDVHKALVSYPMDFEVWDKFDVEKLKAEGIHLSRLHDQLVKNICQAAWKMKLDGHEIPVVNTAIAWSEVGAELLERFPNAPFVASFTVFKNDVMWSLRSKPGFDVSAVAKKFGGGGHECAAGFKGPRF